MPTKIEWCDETWNPVTGCSPVSDGCTNCYASRQIRSGRTPAVHGSKDFEKLTFHPHRLDQPLRWKKPRRIFVCSMGDLFHADVPMDWVCEKVLRVIDFNPKHTFMFLTKRPRKMRAVMEYFYRDIPYPHLPLDNLWLGITAENQEMLNTRWPILRDTFADSYFISYEPALGPLVLPPDFLARRERAWLIAGCESGPGRRPSDIAWYRSLRDQCVAAGVPYFLKQMDINGKLVKMPPLDGREWKQFP